ncbi:Mediator of RNA polymerase II transcription subunit 18, partial [Nowakowskiella sp. JEL0407]
MVQHAVLLTGAISNSQLLPLLERLVGLTGKIEFNGCENYAEHEIALTPKHKTPFGPARNNDIMIRLRCDLLDSENEQSRWRICHLGVPEPVRASTKANSRAVYDISVNGDAKKYVEALGYTFSFEYLKKGFEFVSGDFQVLIYKTFNIVERGDVSSAKLHPKAMDIWIVELSSLVPQEYVERRSAEVHRFSTYLKG